MSEGDINSQSTEQNYIHQALRTCNIEEVKKAVEFQKNRINEKDDKLGWVPLYKAVLYGDEQIVEFLLKNNADPNIRNKLDDTPLHLCIENNYNDIFKILLKYKADPNIKGPEGLSPLHAACFSQKEQFIAHLLSYGADINVKTANGTTPLHIAAESNNSRMIRLLLERNPKISSQDKDGKTAIDYCSDKNCRYILEEYESNCMNPLNESLISCQGGDMSDLSKKLDQSQISTLSTQSKKTKQLNTSQLRQNWDSKISGLKQNIKEVKSLKLEVSKTLQEHKLKESQRNEMVSQLKRKDELELQSKLNYDENDKENCSSIINFIVNENAQVYPDAVDKGENQSQRFFSSNYELPSLDISMEMKKEIMQAVKNVQKIQAQEANRNNQMKEINTAQQEITNDTLNRYQIDECKTISKWLREINLECILQNFLDNSVYDNQVLLKYLNNSNDWDKLLITLFGVDKYGHRQRIITKILEDCGIEKRNGIFSMKYNLGGVQLPSVDQWLKSLNLQQYTDLFLLTGFDDLESMMFQMTTDHPITDEMLFKEVGICDHNARKQILDSLCRDAQNAQMVAVPKGFCGGFNFETTGGSNTNKCDNKCTIF